MDFPHLGFWFPCLLRGQIAVESLTAWLEPSNFVCILKKIEKWIGRCGRTGKPVWPAECAPDVNVDVGAGTACSVWAKSGMIRRAAPKPTGSSFASPEDSVCQLCSTYCGGSCSPNDPALAPRWDDPADPLALAIWRFIAKQGGRDPVLRPAEAPYSPTPSMCSSMDTLQFRSISGTPSRSAPSPHQRTSPFGEAKSREASKGWSLRFLACDCCRRRPITR